jgi:hypothetical protein
LQNRPANIINFMRSRDPIYAIGSEVLYQPNYQTFDHLSPASNNAQFPRVITRPLGQPESKISVLSGPLSHVIPHPKPRMHSNLKAKNAARVRPVATAKSFPGILKDTSLDVTNSRRLH